MNNQIVKFQDRDDIRIITDDAGELWFCAMDVCWVLGYKRFDTQLIKNVPHEFKGTKIFVTLGGKQKLWFFTEKGLYFFLNQSVKPAALPFKIWMADVAVNIRKTGLYVDINRKLTTLSPHQITDNLAAVYKKLKDTLPDLRITDTCNLLSSGEGDTSLNDETPEQRRYFLEMDKFNLPGIIVVEKKPITIKFVWLKHHLHSQETKQVLFKALSGYSKGRQCLASFVGCKPFESVSTLEELTGFKTVQEAQALADTLRSCITDHLQH